MGSRGQPATGRRHIPPAGEVRMAIAYVGRLALPPRDPSGDHHQRHYLFNDLFHHHYDDSILDHRTPRRIHRWIPSWARQAAEIHRRRNDYDVVVTWNEKLSVALMVRQFFAREKKPHIPMLYWFSRRRTRLALRAFRRHVHALVTWTSVQRQYAIRELGISSEKLYLVKHFVDERFFRPRPGEDDRICTAGAEMRDYPTLVEAMRGTDIPCHIAADHVRYANRFVNGGRASIDDVVRDAPPNVTFGWKTPTELRDLYARSRFVVVPLQPSDTDNGVTVILEAMAMGKPVICSRTEGQVDVIEHGVTGIYVPQGDPAALRDAIVDLWNDPERAKRMGAAARAYVETHHPLEKFCRDVKSAVLASLSGEPARRDGSI
jgi:glycosyltransferase involved in cell wall biosynthesis